MISNMTVDELVHVARNGGGFVLSARRLTLENLVHIARNMQANAYLEIAESDAMTADEMVHIARNAVGQIVFS